MVHEVAPLYSDIAAGPAGGTAHWATTQDGLRIRLGHWPAAAAERGTILLFPGRSEYIEKYGISAGEFARAGFHTLAIDWRGQGLSDRMLQNPLLGHVEKFTDYQHDVRAAVEMANHLDLPKPWYLLAHSMGGALGLRALIEGLPVNACVFSAPMWQIKLPPLLRPVAKVLGTFSPWLGIGDHLAPTTQETPYVLYQDFDGNALTNDPDMYKMLQHHMREHHDLQIGGPTVQWVTQGLSECAHLAGRPAPALPCLTFLGTNESIVDTDAIHSRMADWPDGKLSLVAGAQHEVLMEGPSARNAAYQQIIEFFELSRAT